MYEIIIPRQQFSCHLTIREISMYKLAFFVRYENTSSAPHATEPHIFSWSATVT